MLLVLKGYELAIQNWQFYTKGSILRNYKLKVQRPEFCSENQYN